MFTLDTKDPNKPVARVTQQPKVINLSAPAVKQAATGTSSSGGTTSMITPEAASKYLQDTLGKK